MGTLNFTVGKYAKSRGSGAATLMSSRASTSGAHTTSTSASFVEDAGGDITASIGDVFACYADEGMWLQFGGSAAAVGTGHYIEPSVTRWIEVADAGKVSAIDEA